MARIDEARADRRKVAVLGHCAQRYHGIGGQLQQRHHRSTGLVDIEPIFRLEQTELLERLAANDRIQGLLTGVHLGMDKMTLGFFQSKFFLRRADVQVA